GTNTLERAIDVGARCAPQLLRQHRDNRANLRVDALEVVTDQACAHLQENLDLGRIGAPTGRTVQPVFEEMLGKDRTAVDDELEIFLGPMLLDGQEFFKPGE